MAVRKLPRHHRWTWAVPGIIVVALLAAFFNPADQAITQGDFDVVERVVRRTLAYVFLEDGTLLNAEIIKQGYGHAYTQFPFSRMEEFRRLEREAREEQRGLWQQN